MACISKITFIFSTAVVGIPELFTRLTDMLTDTRFVPVSPYASANGPRVVVPYLNLGTWVSYRILNYM